MLKNVLQEVVISTKGENVEQLCGYKFRYKLNEYLNFGTKNVGVGVRNTAFPRMRRSIDYKLYFGHFLEKYDENKLKSFSVEFCSMEELCMHIENSAHCALGVFTMPSLDFGDSRKPMSVQGQATIRVEYKHDRLRIIKHPDLLLKISPNLARLFCLFKPILDSYSDAEKVNKSRTELIEQCTKIVSLSECDYVSEDYVHFVDTQNMRLKILLHNLIESYSLVSSGGRHPIMFTVNKNDNVMNSNELIALKRVSVPFLKMIEFTILNDNMQPFSICDTVVIESFEFTLVFFSC